MRRLIACALLALSAGCGRELLGPVTNCDGRWNGAGNGYGMGMTLAQTGADVTGSVQITGSFGFVDGAISGTCVAPNVNLVIAIPGFDAVTYIGTLSSSAAEIDAHLNGSGFENLELNVIKKK